MCPGSPDRIAPAFFAAKAGSLMGSHRNRPYLRKRLARKHPFLLSWTGDARLLPGSRPLYLRPVNTTANLYRAVAHAGSLHP